MTEVPQKPHPSNVDVLTLFEKKKCVYVCAPMVRYSKLQFRNLLRRYNCDLCYTPMIMADSFCRSAKARFNEFTTSLGDVPLISQFAANTVHDFVGAANMVAPYCNGVDLNCGCPQRWAKQLGVGCCLLEKPELISDLIRQCRNQIPKPFTVSVKMRLGRDDRSTIGLCRQLEKAGVSFIAIHARTPSQHTGSINTEVLKLVNEAVGCPIIANGDVKTLEACDELRKVTNCRGVMVANGLLTNPTLFTGTNQTSLECVQNWCDICYNSTLDLNKFQRLSTDPNLAPTIPEKPLNLTFQCFHHHLVFMLEKVLPRRKRQIFNNLQKFADVLEFLKNELNIVPRLFSASEFLESCPSNIDYKNSDEIYELLKTKFVAEDAENECGYYDYLENQGSFYEGKVAKTSLGDYDLVDLFIEQG